MYSHEDDKFNIPDYIKQMSQQEINEAKNQILMELEKTPIMKLWYLYCEYTREYAVVYAKDEDDAYFRLFTNKDVDSTYIKDWKIEEFNQNKYDGILYFN